MAHEGEPSQEAEHQGEARDHDRSPDRSPSTGHWCLQGPREVLCRWEAVGWLFLKGGKHRLLNLGRYRLPHGS
jgi:hypothetical protein